MVKTIKPKRIVREIKPKIRIIEPEIEEQSVGEPQEAGEAPLEEMIVDAPSSREFPTLSAEQARELAQERGAETQTPAATTESEAASGAKYSVQRDISEAEIRKIYQSRATISRQAGSEQTISIPEIRDSKAMFKNREIESLRTEQTDEKYSIDLEPKAPSQKRKLPWEV